MKEEYSMFKDKLKALIEKQNGEGNNKKKIENLVVLLIILVVTIVIINFIWHDDGQNKKTEKDDPNKKLASNNVAQEKEQEDAFTKQLENILANIDGVGRVKVLIHYSQTSQTVPMYQEETSQKDTEEKDTGGGSRKVIETEVKKDIIYEESSRKKNAYYPKRDKPKN